uniref:Protein kinase domain-containing protein n=1 Tax=Graphocephala atropunctata TaxID=36148 RepID=A0A1B6LHI4_9HEMI
MEPISSIELSSMLPFVFGGLIGHGSFGGVYVAKQNNVEADAVSDLCAVKIICMEDVPTGIWNIIMDEINVMKELKHDNLMKALSTFSLGCIMCRVLPLMVYQSCDVIINSSFPYGMPEHAVGMILRDILSALTYLHDHNFIHRAVKGSHILINEIGSAQLTSFQYMIKMKPDDEKLFMVDHLQYMSKNVNWLSPEILKQDSVGYSYNSDVYSLGITACELANGVVPFADMNASLMLLKKLTDTPPVLWDKSFLISENQASSSQHAVPRRPVGSNKGQENMPHFERSTSSTDSGSDDEITFGAADIDEMNKVYMDKSYSKDFKNFVELILVVDAENRLSAHSAMKHIFVRTYTNIPGDELLQVLCLSNPIEFKSGEEKQGLAEIKTGLLKSVDEVCWDFSFSSPN